MIAPDFLDGARCGGQETDAALVARAQRGDSTAFDTLFTRHQQPLTNYVCRLCGDLDDARDFVQDTCVKAFVAIASGRYDERSYFRTWLYRIATNVWVDEARHRKLVGWQPWDAFVSAFHRGQVAPDNPERDVLNRDTAEDITLVLERLNPHFRMALVLRDVHELTYDECAAAMDTTRIAFKSVLFRARTAFRLTVRTDPVLAARFAGVRDERARAGNDSIGQKPRPLPVGVPPWPDGRPVPDGAALRAWRERLGYTRTTLGQRYGYSEPVFWAAETPNQPGSTPTLRARMAALLAHAETFSQSTHQSDHGASA